MGCGCVQGVHGGHPQVAAVGQVGTNLVGVKWDVAEKVSVNEEDLLGLVTFQSNKSIQDVCVGAELNGEQRSEVMEVLRRYEEIFTEIPGKARVIESIRLILLTIARLGASLILCLMPKEVRFGNR